MKMQAPKYVRYGVVICLLFFAAACGGEEPAEAPAGDAAQETGAAEPGATADAGLVATGQELFAGQAICFTCHGQDATGTQLAPNLTDAEWINIEEPVTPEKIQQLIRTGVQQPKQHPAPMPAMGGADLTDQQIEALAAYVYSLTHG